jgi:hypothetical protein
VGHTTGIPLYRPISVRRLRSNNRSGTSFTESHAAFCTLLWQDFDNPVTRTVDLNLLKTNVRMLRSHSLTRALIASDSQVVELANRIGVIRDNCFTATEVRVNLTAILPLGRENLSLGC